MKKRTKIIIMLAAVCAGTLALAACTANPHKQYADSGYSVSVRWDMNGGLVESVEDTHIVDDYPLEAVKKGVKLFDPSSEVRGTKLKNYSRSGYFLAGWYRTREPRVNADGNPLDMYGNICKEVSVTGADGKTETQLLSEAGYPQGYMYSGKWDFESDRLQLDDYEYKDGEYALVLYAGWVPWFGYEIMGETSDANGNTTWEVFAKKTFDPTLDASSGFFEIGVPAWNSETGALDYGDYPVPASEKNVTLVKTYSDSAKTAEVDQIENTGGIDYDTGTCTQGIARYYATWENGLWYKISNADQLISNAAVGGANRSFDILEDIDFTGKTWPSALVSSAYTGTFRGNNHTLSNITAVQNGSKDDYGGLFGAITEKGTVENVTFEDVTLRFETLSDKSGSYFGLFAGEIFEDAAVTNVSISGKMIFGADVIIPREGWDPFTQEVIPAPHYYDIGLVSGNKVTKGISAEHITVEGEGRVRAAANADGTVTVS